MYVYRVFYIVFMDWIRRRMGMILFPEDITVDFELQFKLRNLV